MSKFSELTRGMPPERVKAVVPGALSRLLYRLGLRRVRRELLSRLAIARLFWRIDWWRDGHTTDVEFWMEELAQIDFDWSFQPGARRATGAGACPGRYIAAGVDHLSLTLLYLEPGTARVTTFDWRHGPLAICLIGDEGEKLPLARAPRLILQLTIEAIHVLLGREQPLEEKEVSFAESEGGLVCRAEGKELRLTAPS